MLHALGGQGGGSGRVHRGGCGARSRGSRRTLIREGRSSGLGQILLTLVGGSVGGGRVEGSGGRVGEGHAADRHLGDLEGEGAALADGDRLGLGGGQGARRGAGRRERGIALEAGPDTEDAPGLNGGGRRLREMPAASGKL